MVKHSPVYFQVSKETFLRSNFATRAQISTILRQYDSSMGRINTHTVTKSSITKEKKLWQMYHVSKTLGLLYVSSSIFCHPIDIVNNAVELFFELANISFSFHQIVDSLSADLGLTQPLFHRFPKCLLCIF